MPATTGEVYLGNTLISSVQINDGWVRPSDWLPLPAAQPNSAKILHAVFDQFENFAAVRMITNAGDYQVDWGDGTVDIVASNVIAEHNYDFANPALDGTLTSRGYKQAIIVITPVSGNFAQAIFNVRPVSPANLQNYATGFLDINVNLPNLTGTFQIGGGIVRHSNLERVNITSWGNITSAVNLLASCASLQSTNETEWDFSNITTIQNLFQNCSSLKSLDCSNWNLSSCNNAVSAFSGCSSLTEILIPTTSFAANANLNNMFTSCNSLIELDLSGLNVSNVTNMSSMLNRCSSLMTINITGWNTSSVTDVNNMFVNCYSLQEIPLMNFAAVTNFASFALSCNSLVAMKATGISQNVSFASCLLGATALNEIYTNLATVTGKTITVTGNYGTAGDNPAIAEAKGWTVVS